MKVRSFVHKGLKRFYEDDITKGIPPKSVGKLRNMLAFLDNMYDPADLQKVPFWKAHKLSGDRHGEWSLRVTANRRLTFRIDMIELEINDLDLVDYH